LRKDRGLRKIRGEKGKGQKKKRFFKKTEEMRAPPDKDRGECKKEGLTIGATAD